jgi:hypothetical protein
MNYFFMLFGGFFVCIGVVMLFASQAMIGWLRRYMNSLSVFIGAIVFRAILGIVFFAYADVSSFPRTFEVIGLFSIAGAAFVGLMGRENLASFMEWVLDIIPKYVYPIEGVLVIALGGFIVYAVL